LRQVSKEDAAPFFGLIFQQAKQSKTLFDHTGLMQGSSGIGYTLLRYLDQSKALPQVLLLE
jgi:lantibiotic modifying enzyme